MDSVSPEVDSVFIAQTRERMNEIRRTQHRPTVALVLSGGGAKGAAHIGVKKVLDELEIPVDLICGTSMGSLMGGLMALGYDSEFLDSLLKNQDWNLTISDRIDPNFIPYTTKMYKSKYLVTIPFHYEKPPVEVPNLKNVPRQARRQARLEFAARDENKQSRSFASSLPAGYAYGLNVNNFFSSLSVGYQDSIAFRDLPIPFCCVAADIVSCKAKNFGSGSIKTAMRSSMSIPGLFDPVRTDGMVLVDGGTRNNFPVDLAKAMGADYIIGVELSNLSPDYEQVNNVGNVFMQFITMLGKDAFDKNVDKCDVYIKPDMEGFNMLSFNSSAIDTIISRGYRAAAEKKDSLQMIKDHLGESLPQLNSCKATDINTTPVQISGIEFLGMSDIESRILMRKIKLQAGQYVDKKIMDEAMAKIHATGAFEFASYSLLGSEEPYRLVFDCVKGPVHRAGLGLRLDSEEKASLLFNLGLNTQKIQGSTLDISGKIGINQYGRLRYSLDFPSAPTFNAEMSIRGINTTTYLSSPKFKANYLSSTLDFVEHEESIYFSNIKWTNFDLQLGAMNKYCDHGGQWLYSEMGGTKISGGSFGDHLSAFAKGTLYSLDDRYYPTKGASVDLKYGFDFLGFDSPNFIPTHIMSLDYTQPIMLGKVCALIPSIHARFLFNNSPYDENNEKVIDAMAYYNNNLVGGSLAGRYKEHQIPFCGFDGSYMAKDKVVILGAEFRVNPVSELYLSAKVNALKEAERLDTMLEDLKPSFWGLAVEVGYNSIIGPLKANLHWSDFTHELQAYFSIGFDF